MAGYNDSMKKASVSFLMKWLPGIYGRMHAHYNLIWDKRSYLFSTGWLQSKMKGYPVSVSGEPIPYMNYAIIDFLDQRLQKTHRLFEFGSGYSTLFYSKRAGEVTSVEHDRYWYDKVSAMVGAKAAVLHIPEDADGAYCRSIHMQDTTYDIVIVDGRDRVNCVVQSFMRLTNKGVIIVDDTERESYQGVFAMAQERGFKGLDFVGLKPIGNVSSRCTLFYRQDNCLSV